MKKVETLSEINGVRLRVGGTRGAGWTGQNIKTGQFMTQADIRKSVPPGALNEFLRGAMHAAMTRMSATGKVPVPSILQRNLNFEYVNVEFTGADAVFLALSRADGISRGLNELGSSPEMRTAMMQLYEAAVDRVRELADMVLLDFIYDTPEPERGGWTDLPGMQRTNTLYDSVIGGIQATEYGVFIGVDEKFYTDGTVYWMAVEKGHQVTVPPNQIRTGAFMPARPFMNALYSRVMQEIIPWIERELSVIPSMTAEIVAEIINAGQQPTKMLALANSGLYGSQYHVDELTSATEGMQGTTFSLSDIMKSELENPGIGYFGKKQ